MFKDDHVKCTLGAFHALCKPCSRPNDRNNFAEFQRLPRLPGGVCPSVGDLGCCFVVEQPRVGPFRRHFSSIRKAVLQPINQKLNTPTSTINAIGPPHSHAPHSLLRAFLAFLFARLLQQCLPGLRCDLLALPRIHLSSTSRSVLLPASIQSKMVPPAFETQCSPPVVLTTREYTT